MDQYAHDIPSPVDAYETVFVPAMLDPLARAAMDHIDARQGARALDLACGTGIVARRLAPVLGADGAIVAVDISAEMLAKARALPAPDGAPIEWREDDATALDLPEGTFDIVVCQQSLQYMSDRPAVAAECRRMLADGGRAILSVWRALEHSPLFRELVEVEARHLGKLGVTYEELAAPFLMDSAEELHDLLAAAGFRQIAVNELAIEARFPSAASFVRDVEIAYASVMPQFVQDPGAFEDFVRKVEHDMRAPVKRWRDGDGVRFPMKTHIATASR
ncbi:MAG TPA: methyltransferase domain-containing protein [Alphaproteobacteria bacterium]|jgi:ubiquinone/menaquinone biosynthesis C-methylase UbiE|nr:methyltransferase domain-containing protein [Alphaproteobacteria bacterium]